MEQIETNWTERLLCLGFQKRSKPFWHQKGIKARSITQIDTSDQTLLMKLNLGCFEINLKSFSYEVHFKYWYCNSGILVEFDSPLTYSTHHCCSFYSSLWSHRPGKNPITLQRRQIAECFWRRVDFNNTTSQIYKLQQLKIVDI